MVRNDTQILMCNGKSKRLDHIHIGEQVVTYAEKKVSIQGLCLRNKSGYLIAITLEEQQVIWCAPAQRFFTTEGMLRADDIKVGMLMENEKQGKRVIEVRWVPFKGILRSLMLPHCEGEKGLLVYANGFAIEVYDKKTPRILR